MPRRIVMSLSEESAQSAMRGVQNYRKNLLRKCVVFVNRLADKGIVVARQNTGNYGAYVTFAKEVEPTAYGAKGIMYGTSNGLIASEWRSGPGPYDVKVADVSPLLMVEFGSGLRADNPRAGEFGMGTGTFPGQIHAEDPDGWWYQTLDGEWHHSYGVTPSMPMTKASAEMIDQIRQTAREVFGA